MKLCRFHSADGPARVGLIHNGTQVLDLTSAKVARLDELLAEKQLLKHLDSFTRAKLPSRPLGRVKLLPPVDHQEIWAVGVTYLRSKTARMEESDFSATAYDKVYDAARPELFFKAMPYRVVGPGAKVGIREDAKWNVPEPELALVFSPRGKLVGYTIGNDVSSRDIEGENLLYLPQAKIYDGACALGPWVEVGASEVEARTWIIRVSIKRGGKEVFAGDTSVGRIKRTFGELQEYLFRSQTLAHGAILLTGTGVVPGDNFTLQPKDEISIGISGIGELRNTVAVV